MTQESNTVTIQQNNQVTNENSESATLCGIKPVNFVVTMLVGSTFISVIWSFYSVAIEIIPMQETFLNCPYNIEYGWTPGNNTVCKNFLETQKNYNVAESTFWSLMIVAGLSPWVVISLIAVITTHDKVNKNIKNGGGVFLDFYLLYTLLFYSLHLSLV